MPLLPKGGAEEAEPAVGGAPPGFGTALLDCAKGTSCSKKGGFMWGSGSLVEPVEVVSGGSHTVQFGALLLCKLDLEVPRMGLQGRERT